MYLKVLICCLLTVVVVNCQTPSKGVEIPATSKCLLYPVRRIPYPRIVLATDGYQYYLTTFYNIPATFRVQILIINGLRMVDDELTGLRYVILGSDLTSDLILAQLYMDRNNTNVIFNPNTNAYEKVSFDASGNMVFIPYTDGGKLIAFKLVISQYIMTDDNNNAILVTMDTSNNRNYRFQIYNDSQTQIPYTYSLLTGQGYLVVYEDSWTCKIKLLKLERELSGNFVAQNTDTGERRYVYYDEFGQLAFSSYPNYPPAKPTLTNILNLPTGTGSISSVPATQSIY